MKKLIAAATALCLIAGAAAYIPEIQSTVPVITATAETYGDFEYTVSSGTVTISKYTGRAKSVKIPSSIGGKKVTFIASMAFLNCTAITEVTIPDTVTTIGSDAFSGCTGLKKINIPKGVSSIRVGTFSGCTGLEEVTLPDSVTNIGSEAFSGCTGLKSINIPDSVTSIGEMAFYNCISLKSINVPGNASIGDNALGYYESEKKTYDVIPDFTIFCFKQRYVEPQPWSLGGWYNTNAYSYVTVNYELTHVFLDGSAAYGTSFGGDGIALEGATITFTDKENKTSPAVITGSAYVAAVMSGEYIVTVSKKGYVTREYYVTLTEGEPIKLDLEIHKLGDVDGSGDINASDVALVTNHVKKTKLLSEYDRQVGNIDGKGDVSASDVAAITSHVKGVKLIG